MHVINARNVNDAYAKGVALLAEPALRVPSRAGPVRMHDEPVCTRYSHPNECVLFDANRDANPFFHLMESLWMLAGRNDVEYVSLFNAGMKQFSDDGATYNGAYGYRWNGHWKFDQLAEIIGMLRADSTTRRVVLQMWDPEGDLGTRSLDIPCNLSIAFNARATGLLRMTVFCRSNDMIFGAYGANAVHMNYLHQYIAHETGLRVGEYYQVSNDFHAYENTWSACKLDEARPALGSRYDLPNSGPGAVHSLPLGYNTTPQDCLRGEIVRFCKLGLDGVAYGDEILAPFLRLVALPMRDAFHTHRVLKDTRAARELLISAQETIWSEVPESSPRFNDWIAAGQLWLNRRAK